MKINRQNYEHWFIDFIEGDLNTSDEAMVRKFVQLNPDLSAELEGIKEFAVVPEAKQYNKKDLLKQDPLKAVDEITKFERLSIAYLENDLDENEQAELDRFILNSNQKREEFQLLQKTKLSVDADISYSAKTKLKKLFVVPAKTFNYKILYRVAAIFVLLLGLTIVFNLNDDKNQTGKQLSRLKTMTILRKVVVGTNKKEQIAVRKEQPLILKNMFVVEQVRPAIEIPEKLAALSYELLENKPNSPDYFIDNINNYKQSIDNTPVKIKASFDRRLLYAVNTTRRTLGIKIKTAFKRHFKYEKIKTDDGRTLIALKAGDMEYRISKKQRNK